MLVLGLAAALTLGPASGEASAEIDLRWSAPAGCPDVEQARALVARLVPGSTSRLHAVARIEATAGGFVGTLELPAESGPSLRRLEAEDCMVLTRAMAVVLAVSLDPLAAAAEADRSVVPEPDATPIGATPRGPEAVRARRRAEPTTGPAEPSDGTGTAAEGAAGDGRAPVLRSARGDLDGGVRIGAGVGGLLLPAAGVGLALAPFIAIGRVHVRAVAHYWVPQKVAFDPSRDASGELQLVTGGLRVCPGLERGRVRIPLCVGADAGTVLGRGIGRDLRTSRTAREPWVGAVLEPGVTVGVTSRVSLWLALAGVVSLYRPRFVVEGAPQAWTAGAGAIQGLFGVEVHARRDRSQNP